LYCSVYSVGEAEYVQDLPIFSYQITLKL